MHTSFRSRVLPREASLLGKLQALAYPPVNGSGRESPAAEAVVVSAAGPEAIWQAASLPASQQPNEQRYTEAEVLQRENRARDSGFEQGRQQERALWQPKLEAERAALAAALEQFQKSQEAYFRKLEREAVSLTLAIARKILNREAQVDPLLLGGAVRVALDKVAVGTAVTLRVPAAEVDKWRYWLGTETRLQPPPEVVADPALTGPQCFLESEVGSTDLSVETQLKEIEQGFMDMLALRDS